jgi:hypothetical protein
MRRLTSSELKDFLSGVLLTGGFTLLSSGVGMIGGPGAGLIVGGIGLFGLQQWWSKTGG